MTKPKEKIVYCVVAPSGFAPIWYTRYYKYQAIEWFIKDTHYISWKQVYLKGYRCKKFKLVDIWA